MKKGRGKEKRSKEEWSADSIDVLRELARNAMKFLVTLMKKVRTVFSWVPVYSKSLGITIKN